ncbi:MAG TPA: GAP family protein [Conexibacter sp.]|nr:GAP family protein [Conexibacter sp.]
MSLLVLAFEAALYPTLLAAVVILLSLERPKRLIAAYLAGGMTISITLGLLIVELLGGTNLVESQQSLLSWTGDLVIGGLAVLLAVALAMHADDRMRERRSTRRAVPVPVGGAPAPIAPDSVADAPNAEPWSQRLLARGSVPVVFVAALFVNIPGAAYLVALKDIAAADQSFAADLGQILLFNVIMFLLAEIPLVGLIVAPEKTNALVDRMNTWLHDHSRQLAIGICFTLGVYLIVRGLTNA